MANRPERRSPSSPPVGIARTAFEQALRFNLVPAADRKDPPNYEPISSIDFIIKVLTRDTLEADGANPFAGHWTDIFLQALAKAPIVTVAARIAGVSRAHAIQERSANPDFARRWDDAMEEGVDEIEAAAYLSAVYGEAKPVFYRGERIGWTVDYSHPMRSMLLKARRPGLFAEKKAAKSHGWVNLTLDEFRKRVEEAKRMAASFPPL